MCRMVGVENEAKLFRRKGNSARSGQMFASRKRSGWWSVRSAKERDHVNRPGSQRDKQRDSHSKRLDTAGLTQDGLNGIATE